MIQPGARLELRRIALADLRVFEHQARYPEQVMRYVDLVRTDETGADLGVIHVKPLEHGYEILDGHHRFCALVLTGRPDALCLIIDESGL